MIQQICLGIIALGAFFFIIGALAFWIEIAGAEEYQDRQ